MISTSSTKTKASNRRDSIELSSRIIIAVCTLLRSEKKRSWLHCSDIFGIAANKLNTLRINASGPAFTTYADISAEAIVRVCNVLRLKPHEFNWIRCAFAFNISVNVLKTLRKNAKK